jgi:hypothetical protein
MLRSRIVDVVITAVALVALHGCGETCPTETPAKVDRIGSCVAQPGATVSVPVQLCPTCNQSGATCDVDLSAVASSGTIQLDPTVEACENVTTCATPTPSCEVSPFTCTFAAPMEPGDYDLIVFDPSRNGTIGGVLHVESAVSSGCDLPAVTASR